ncbi:type II toxin-antitoxin system VapC family toxin [Avibacterium paragallinarum]|uniref:type II toxin-antitoxin system VapC family toxin n=1 Tax=Avibacterium TaxID=292486 RepID=UPI003BF8B9C9
MNGILLDANILIDAFNNKDGESAAKLKMLMEDKNTIVFITPLISYEVLRGLSWEDKETYQKVKAAIASFASLNIDHKITNLASELFRFEKYERDQKGQETKKIDKHNFDIVHFSTAKIHNLELISNDKDMQSWDELYQKI